MKLLPATRRGLLISALTLGFAACAIAQSTPQSSEGIESGKYNIHQTVEFGYRNTDISGNLANYNTFVNLNSGVRLFEQSLDIRSLNHAGALFDSLSMYSFG